MPQIVLNATKGVRRPLNRTYVVGMSAARLVVPLYIYGCPENFIHLLVNDAFNDYRVRAAPAVRAVLCVCGRCLPA